MGAKQIALPSQTRRLRFCRFSHVKLRVKTFAAGLACHPHESYEIVRRCSRNTTSSDATIAIAIEHAAFVIERDFVEIEQDSPGFAPTLLPDTRHALHWSVGCGLACRPSCRAIISGID